MMWFFDLPPPPPPPPPPPSFLSHPASWAVLFVATLAALCLFAKRIRAWVLWHIQDGLDSEAWERLPKRIILLRHGQAEHNLEGAAILKEENPDRKADNLSELTELGREQALEAGGAICRLLGDRGTISVVVSPFERTQQTLYSLQRALGRVKVRCVHVDPRVREQEFGNFQKAGDMGTHAQVAREVGRFYYRRPTGESGADVYDRASTFWESLLGGALTPQEALVHNLAPPDDAMLVVTHGLTLRLLLMRYFAWSPQTFDAVYNPGNCDFWVLAKDPSGARRYQLEPSACSPPRMPWATKQVRVVRHGGGTSDHTLVDYLSLPQPRTAHPLAALKSLVPGHIGHTLDPSRTPDGRERTREERMRFIDATKGLISPVPPEDVERIDWWCGKISDDGVALRLDNRGRRASLVSPGSRRRLFE
jgi:broad specificity phosphatase PhoE